MILFFSQTHYLRANTIIQGETCTWQHLLCHQTVLKRTLPVHTNETLITNVCLCLIFCLHTFFCLHTTLTVLLNYKPIAQENQLSFNNTTYKLFHFPIPIRKNIFYITYAIHEIYIYIFLNKKY